MNTQTHLLLGAACLAPVSVSGEPATRTVRWLCAAALLGSFLPDASLYAMWLVGKASGVADQVLFSDWYYRDSWQRAGAVSNSLPMLAALLAVAWWQGGRFGRRALDAPLFASLVVTVAMAALIHVATDFPLHHDDGRPHFWPFSDWIFRSPVSYWDPEHHGNLWAPVEIVLALVLAFLLWRRFGSRVVRAVLLLAVASYLVVGAYWASAFG